jgi:ATP-dependent DNA helicase UvrD/PcrA
MARRESWRPIGINDLEPAAWEALKYDGCVCVTAGPGSGKTEFLAQRAAYLLQTGAEHHRFRILAISFKRDAASNLADRVKRRCTFAQGARFDSVTFDAFAKSLIDRFISLIPEVWRPTPHYTIEFPTTRQITDFLYLAQGRAPTSWVGQVAGVRALDFQSKFLGAYPLPAAGMIPTSGAEFAISQWWTEYLRGKAESGVTFTMINRLAELLQRHNTQVALALRRTYPYVFVDEFQDTTYAQYDFLRSLFGSPGGPKITAVGDDKQRIMGWAGARDDAFNEFVREFDAERFHLSFNHRSSPALVALQHVVARQLEPTTRPAEAKAPALVAIDTAVIWTFSDSIKEAHYISRWISQDMLERALSPRDYALLVKQRADDFEEYLVESFARAGLTVRNEAREVNGFISIQDLLTEPMTRLVLAIAQLIVRPSSPEAWCYTTEVFERLSGVATDDDVRARRVHDALSRGLAVLKKRAEGLPLDEFSTEILTSSIFALIDFTAMGALYPEYRRRDYLEHVCGAIAAYLSECANASSSWSETVGRFEGADSVPLMTIHKSKGLEFDTVLCMGLDDASWWSYGKQRRESTSVFFVALSRAKQRIVYTFTRDNERVDISALYRLLTDAGVRELNL